MLSGNGSEFGKKQDRKRTGLRVAATVALPVAAAAAGVGLVAAVEHNNDAKTELAAAGNTEWAASEGNHLGDMTQEGVYESVRLGDQDAAGIALGESREGMPDGSSIDSLITPTPYVNVDMPQSVGEVPPGTNMKPSLRDEEARQLAVEAAQSINERNTSLAGSAAAGALAVAAGAGLAATRRKQDQ